MGTRRQEFLSFDQLELSYGTLELLFFNFDLSFVPVLELQKRRFPLTPMVVHAPCVCSCLTPIVMNISFWCTCLQSHLQTPPPTPKAKFQNPSYFVVATYEYLHSFRTLRQILQITTSFISLFSGTQIFCVIEDTMQHP